MTNYDLGGTKTRPPTKSRDKREVYAWKPPKVWNVGTVGKKAIGFTWLLQQLLFTTVKSFQPDWCNCLQVRKDLMNTLQSCRWSDLLLDVEVKVSEN